MSGVELRDGIVGARVVICNDYEFELIRQKSEMGEDDVLKVADVLIVTRGEEGSSIYQGSARVDVKAVPPTRIVDPTGVGDAFRGGLMKGLAGGESYQASARLGSVAATYALEHLGGQSHAYSLAEFSARHEEHFGALPAFA
jgi:adenosine kinase